MIRFLHILVAWVLLLSTSGVTITAFYCQNQISGISLMSTASNCSSEKKCCAKKAEDHKKCCDSESGFFQIDIDQLSFQTNYDSHTQDILMPLVVQANTGTLDLNRSKINEYALYNRPPPLDRGFHILYQRFLC